MTRGGTLLLKKNKLYSHLCVDFDPEDKYVDILFQPNKSHLGTYLFLLISYVIYSMLFFL